MSSHDTVGAAAPLSPASPNCPSVACVILNWNGWQDSLACLAAVAEIEYAHISVIVVDNGSTDDSVAHIRAAFPAVELIENGTNLGFGAGNNVALRVVMSRSVDYVWLLNNDTRPKPDALTELVRKAETDKKLGAVGSVLFYADQPGRVQAWGGGGVNVWFGRSWHATARVAESSLLYLTAASVLLRCSALAEIGLFDEEFFLYWEDADLGFRLRKGGWGLGVADGSVVLHKEHASTGRDYGVLSRHVVASGIHFLLKHSPLPSVSVALFLLFRMAKQLLTGRWRMLVPVFAGIGDYYRRRRE